jgi:hypothetical protein
MQAQQQYYYTPEEYLELETAATYKCVRIYSDNSCEVGDLDNQIYTNQIGLL